MFVDAQILAAILPDWQKLDEQVVEDPLIEYVPGRQTENPSIAVIAQ
jgi:hypothetical protein